jgi:hypothetical protein
MPRTYATKAARLLKPARNHIRIDLGDDDALTQLGTVYIARPIYPIIVTPELEILDGNRRHAAVMLMNPDAEVPVCITDEAMGESLSPAVMLEIQIESAQFTKGLSDFELFGGYVEWLRLNPSATAKDLASRIHRDEGIVSKILSLRHCIDAVKEAARAGQIGYTVWHQLSKLSPEAQATELAEGTTRAKAQQRRRDHGNGKATTVKASSIPVVLSSGVAVAFKATGDITLTMALDSIAEIKRELEDAIKRDHDAKTFAALMRKRARQMTRRPAPAGA